VVTLIGLGVATSCSFSNDFAAYCARQGTCVCDSAALNCCMRSGAPCGNTDLPCCGGWCDTRVFQCVQFGGGGGGGLTGGGVTGGGGGATGGGSVSVLARGVLLPSERYLPNGDVDFQSTCDAGQVRTSGLDGGVLVSDACCTPNGFACAFSDGGSCGLPSGVGACCFADQYTRAEPASPCPEVGLGRIDVPAQISQTVIGRCNVNDAGDGLVILGRCCLPDTTQCVFASGGACSLLSDPQGLPCCVTMVDLLGVRRVSTDCRVSGHCRCSGSTVNTCVPGLGAVCATLAP
jgi:hypothetical protein